MLLTGERPEVRIDQGTLSGVRAGAAYTFKGIPYAAPPVGPLRFRAPRPAAGWDGVRDASGFGPIAPQPTIEISGTQAAPQSEDCLSLNVYTPELGGAGLPVMVWIHGGAYYVGSSADPLYDGAGLAERAQAVVVTLNYRLGALGYLDFTSFQTADEPFDSNLGQRDQLTALEWVRDNIAAFGGDPEKVVVFGESAGAGAVTTMLATPSARGLFRGAIAESSPVGSVYSRATAADYARRFLDLVGVDPSDIARLRELPVQALTDACNHLVQTNPVDAPGRIPVAPVVDGELVPEYPLDAFAAGRCLRVPLIIGSNRDEAALFKLMKSPILPTTAASIAQMIVDIGSPRALNLPRAYPGYPARSAALKISTDAAFRMPTIWTGAMYGAHAPTWVYQFDYAPPLLKVAGIGAMHGGELPFVWGNLPPEMPKVPLGGSRESALVLARMQSRWSRFAHELDPNPPGADPLWPAYDTEDRKTLVIDRVDRVVTDPGSRQRQAWGDVPISFR
jgi:para-nitrobenzyl esterase